MHYMFTYDCILHENMTKKDRHMKLKLEVESPYIHSQKYVWNKNICPYESSFKSTSSWWLNQPIIQTCESKWFHLPQIRVYMHIYIITT